ncbi:MAG: magnesium chelatase domain-containing protein, partial [Coriobacteriia bacterium]|nr:magnesium chelatase domain-containing protein [Coriobacteriia bacterium]
MGQCTVGTFTLAGVQAVSVDAEVDVGAGLPTFAIVGLGDLAVQEARERVRSALRAAGFEVPNARIVVNLAPGPVRKHGTGFDLPIALGILAATGQVPARLAASCVAIGELSLDGSVRPVTGMLAYALAARDARLALLGPAQAPAATSLDGLDYRPLERLSQLRGGLPENAPLSVVSPPSAESGLDFADVAGHE